MAAGLKISIVTPEADVLDVECDEVIVPGTNGELGMLPQHIPLITALRPGVLTTIKDGRKQYFFVGSGFAEIDDDRISILAGSCEPAETIDVPRAKQAMAKAQSRLDQLAPTDPGFTKAEHKAARAQARLDACARVR